MKIRVIIAITLLALLLSVPIIPVATASDQAPGTIERTIMAETLLTPSSAWSLAPWVVERGSVTLSLDAAGSNEASSTVACMKPSDAATVRRAFMMTATIWGGGSIETGDITIDGNPITWDFVIPNCLQSYNYLTEVTALVKAKVDAAPAGLVSFTMVEVNKNSKIDGEILAVIFDDPAQPPTNYIALLFGSQAMGGDTFTINLDAPIDKADPDLVLDLSLGISFGYQGGGAQQYSIIDVNGQRLSTAAGGEDDGAPANGGLITVGGIGDSNSNPSDPYAVPTNCRSDDELYNLIPFVNDGDTSITVSTSNPSHDDNLMFAALFMSNKISLAEALDYYLHPVTSAGAQEWFGQTKEYCYDGDAARSGDITHGQSTSLQTAVTGPGVFVFYWKISSERKFDTLKLYVDGKPVSYSGYNVEISGERDWMHMRTPLLGDGDHTLEWRYTKDKATSGGQDCGWVDRLRRATVVDYSSPPYRKNPDQYTPFLEFLESMGIRGMLRYIDSGRSAALTKEECETLRQAGFAVGLIWQVPTGGGDEARKRAVLGKNLTNRDAMIASANQTGRDHAQRALAQTDVLGAPDSVAVYFAIDWDFPFFEQDSEENNDELAAICQYFRAISDVFNDPDQGNGRPVGAYGGQGLLAKLLDADLTSYGWACGSPGYYTSATWDPRIQIRQTMQCTAVQYADKKKVDLDFNDIWAGDWGAWEPAPVETLSVPLNTSTGVTTSMTFEADKHYLIEAKGWFLFSVTSIGIRDAKYECTSFPSNCCDINHGNTTTWYGNLRIRGKEADWDWGECNSDHVYRIPYTGEGTELNFYIYDDFYGDNLGLIVVNVFEYP